MAKVYKFQSQDRTIDVDIHTNAFGDIKHFQITDIVGLSPAEVRWGFDLTRDVYYEHEFIAYAKEKSLNLYLWDDETFEGKLNDAIILYTVTISKTGNGTITPDVGEHIYQEGTTVPISIVESDEGYYHESTTVDAVPVTVPYDLVVSGNHIIEHLFLPWQNIMDVFSTAPQLNAGKWKYIDSTPFENHAESNNNCILFDGIDDCDIIPHESAHLIGTSDFTIAFRCIPISGTGTLLSKRIGYLTKWIQFIWGTNGLTTVGYASSGYLNSVGTQNYNELLSATIARTANEWSLWVNGIMVNSDTFSGVDDFAMDAPISIGCYDNAITKYSYTNAIWESFCFEKREWSDSEIQSYHANGTIPTTCLIAKIYNQGNGIYSPDLSGNSYTGIITGGTWIKSSLIKSFSSLYNFSIYKNKVRKYYNQYAVDTGKLAPTGWHVPTDTEWNALNTYLGAAAGTKMKTVGTFGWLAGNTGDNSSGFSANGAGYCSPSDGAFVGYKTKAVYYSATSLRDYYLSYNGTTLTGEACTKPKGNSIRLIKDDSTNPGSLTDYDGNIYPTVKIGNQVWLADDFRCTHYNDGELIPFYTNQTTFKGLTTGGSINYNNESDTAQFIVQRLLSGGYFDQYGFERLTDYTPSNFFKYSENTVTVPVDTDLNAIIPAGAYTWQQIYDLVQSVQLVKTQDVNKISRMVIKKKMSSGGTVSILTDETILTDNTILI
jgi:uncharacterized protein (TIGR02145 family)